ncbi:Plasmodium exported protein, unknown function [Plasmodium vivax]|uniref:Variable surface protein Vir35 n=1 Tax=Plasmodium vivax TaxID=5855 RepID=A0A565A5M8_PLAVI|nr:Plasmodium exported protein, unknown function [Plasmodium vivax]VVA00166.1 Plasmodium exported protein, unknown function [Plasmodium vivax]
MKNIKFISFIKIFVFSLLAWSYSFITNVNNNELNVTFNIRPFRLLTENEMLKEAENYGLREKLSEDVKDKNYKTVKKNKSIYGQLKRQGLNELDIYKKSFACKYSKKKGFKKLDCYCEKKIFDKLEGICLLAKNMKDNKKCFKIVSKRYGIPFVLSMIFVFIVGIFNALGICKVKCFYSATKTQDTLFHVGYSILLDILPITIFLVLSYIMIKVIKYDRLVEGKVEGKKIAKKISCYYDDNFNSG